MTKQIKRQTQSTGTKASTGKTKMRKMITNTRGNTATTSVWRIRTEMRQYDEDCDSVLPGETSRQAEDCQNNEVDPDLVEERGASRDRAAAAARGSGARRSGGSGCGGTCGGGGS